jgi:hypothetical protein
VRWKRVIINILQKQFMIYLSRKVPSLLPFIFLATFFIFSNKIVAQPTLPQRNITVLPTQPLDFGAFCVIGPGTITVDYQGNIFTTGGVISLNTITTTPAIFEIKLCQGRNVTINYDSFVYINGTNGGSLKLNIGPAKRDGIGTILNNLDTFPVDNNCNFITVLRVGGTLDVLANAVQGFYSGSFPVTFSQN